MKKEKKEESEITFLNLLKRKSTFKNYELIIFILIIVSITIILTNIFIIRNLKTKNLYKISSTGGISEIEEVYNLIDKTYYKEVDKQKMIDGAINGMLLSLDDPHTNYFNKEMADNFNEVMEGVYEGIGAEIGMTKDNKVVIVSVFKNSPAKEVGLKFGDIIIEVNGKDATKMNSTEVVTNIKDPKLKNANIKVIRDNKKLNFTLEKRKIVIESVEAKTFTKDKKIVGYILVNNFANNTYDQFRNAVLELEEKNIDGLVIDVRNNSGGYLHSVTNMLSMFLSKGKIMYQIADRNNVDKYKDGTDESRNYPISVLVNKASASASEILAVGLKEAYGADVVGTYSYGKGTVQVTKDLPNGSMIKYTIQKWLSPKGNWINEKGVKPTYEVELSSEFENNPSFETDNQLNKALDVIYNKN